jgi:hypothetical protein
MANTQTPDSIGALPRSRTELIPGAQGVSVYQGGTRADVAEPPQDNRYKQLGAALSHFSANTGVDLVQQAYKKDAAIAEAEGALKARELAKNNALQNLNDAVSKGLIPEGASPAYIFAMKANFLKLRGEQTQMRLRENYYADDKLRNSDDPNAFVNWAAKQTNDNEDAILKDSDGNHQFTALEIAHSNFQERLSDGLKSLEQEHIAHRISEREKMGEQAASGLMAIRLESTAANMPSSSRDNKAIARMLVDVGYNATTGAATYGMNKSKVAGMMQDAIINKAIATKDVTYLDVAKEIKTPGGDLSTTGRYVAMAQQAREHIASQLYIERQHKEQQAMQDAEGTLEQRAAFHGEVYAQTKNEFKKKQFLDVKLNQALNFKSILNLSPKEMSQQQDALEAMRQVDPQAALNASSLILKAKETFQTADNKVHFPLKEMEIHNAILLDPGTPATNKMIDRALGDSAISGEQWLRLRSLSDKASQDGLKFAHILNDDSFKRLETAIGRAVNNSPGDPFGAAALHAGAAQLELRQLAVETAQANPGMSPLMVARTIQPEMKDIAGRYNETMKEVLDNEEMMKKGQEEVTKEALRMSQPAEQKKLQEQVQKAEAQTKLVKEMDKAGKPVNPQTLAAEEAKQQDFNPDTFDTKLSTKNEEAFQAWKKKYAPKDSGADYDLRGAFKAGVKPAANGHWPDTFKKPNHPTFSDESRYAKFGKPGHWEGEKFIPNKK